MNIPRSISQPRKIRPFLSPLTPMESICEYNANLSFFAFSSATKKNEECDAMPLNALSFKKRH